MKLRCLFYLQLLLAVAIPAFGQQQDSVYDANAKPVYFEPAEGGEVRFYFDENYYLVDKECQYVAIERIGVFNMETKGFDGPFADYDMQGNLLLEGNYEKGKKEGIFTAYFTHGKVQWQATFEDDKPIGAWRHHYPDGLPLLEIHYKDNTASLQHFWDDRGRQQVKDGNGKFEFAVKERGYTLYGYDFANYEGRIRNGRPYGTWTINYRYQKGEYNGGYEYFSKTGFRSGYDAWQDSYYHNGSRLQIGPQVYFTQAERMIGKDCSIDEHENFSVFIADRLEKAFTIHNLKQYGTHDVVVAAMVDKDGELQEVDVTKGYEDMKDIRDLIEEVLMSVDYWIPSFNDDAYIDDNLSIRFQVVPKNGEEGAGILINGIKIRRENGY